MFRAAFFAAVALVTGAVSAQCTTGWLPGDAITGVSGDVSAVATLPGGDIVVAGQFGTAGNAQVRAVAHWSRETRTWSAMGALNAGVSSLAVLPNRDVIAGGSFTMAGDVPVSYIARWSWSTQHWSALGSGVNNIVRAVLALPDGDVIAGGQFFQAGGTQANKIARWNAGTATWSALGTGIAENAGGSHVRSLEVLTNGDIIVGGFFDQAGLAPANHVARWNGSSWSGMGAGLSGGNFGGRVLSLTALPNGEVVAGGEFTMSGATPVNYVARWDDASGAWVAMDGGVDDRVYSVVTLADGDVMVGGYFDAAGGDEAIDRIARWDSATSSWSGLMSRLAIGGGVFALDVADDGTVVAGGSFLEIGEAAAVRIAAWSEADGWSALNTGTTGEVRALLTLPNGDTFVGGRFRSIGGISANYVARRDASGQWHPVGDGLDGYVWSLALMPNGDVLAVGSFTKLSGVARWDGSSWSQFGTPTTTTGDIAVAHNGDVFITGERTDDKSGPRHRIKRWTGTEWVDVGSGMTGFFIAQVHDLVVLPNGDLVAAGEFDRAGGVQANNIARWNGTVWAPLGPGSGGAVFDIALRPSGNLLATGDFRFMGYEVFQWNGIAWSRVGTNGVNGLITAIGVSPNDDIYIGGNFTDTQIRRIARLAVGENAWTPLGSGVDNTVYAIEALANGDIAAGGTFTEAGGMTSAYFAIYNYLGSCAADVNCDDTLNSQDFFDFLACFFAAGCPSADFNEDGVANSQDFFDFLDAFFKGC